MLPSLTRLASSTQRRPDVSDPPIKPFYVFPSPKIRLPSFHRRPPSMGQGPYPVLGSHFPHIMAKVFARKPGRYSHKVSKQRSRKFTSIASLLVEATPWLSLSC